MEAKSAKFAEAGEPHDFSDRGRGQHRADLGRGNVRASESIGILIYKIRDKRPAQPARDPCSASPPRFLPFSRPAAQSQFLPHASRRDRAARKTERRSHEPPTGSGCFASCMFLLLHSEYPAPLPVPCGVPRTRPQPQGVPRGVASTDEVFT